MRLRSRHLPPLLESRLPLGTGASELRASVHAKPLPELRYHPSVSIAGSLAIILDTIAKAIEDGAVKVPKPRNSPRGRFISVEALEQLVKTWRERAASEEWGLGHAFDECADALDALVNNPKDGQNERREDEGDQP